MKIRYKKLFDVYVPDKYSQLKSERSPYSIQERIENGLWESEEISILERRIKETDSVLELGACLGILSIVTNRLLNYSKNHTVVEANPKLISVLEKNRDLNRCSFKILNGIVDDPSKNSGKFIPSDFILGSSQYHDNSSSITVPVIPFSRLSNHNFLIVDIEGGEYSLIDNNIIEISAMFNKLLIEFHTQYGFSNKHMTNSIAKVMSHGFKKVENVGNTFYFIK